jgi:hypothetical protein
MFEIPFSFCIDGSQDQNRKMVNWVNKTPGLKLELDNGKWNVIADSISLLALAKSYWDAFTDLYA